MDVATTFHYYEAILACLAIVVWHFYFVIFDPDIYPMNPAWLTGYRPLVQPAGDEPPRGGTAAAETAARKLEEPRPKTREESDDSSIHHPST